MALRHDVRRSLRQARVFVLMIMLLACAACGDDADVATDGGRPHTGDDARVARSDELDAAAPHDAAAALETPGAGVDALRACLTATASPSRRNAVVWTGMPTRSIPSVHALHVEGGMRELAPSSDSMALSPDAEWFATEDNGGLELFSTRTGEGKVLASGDIVSRTPVVLWSGGTEHLAFEVGARCTSAPAMGRT